MTLPQSVILGVVQGITEFFPISSSAHLVIAQNLFGIKEPQLAFDIFLHIGTLISILIYFRKDIADLITRQWRLYACIAVATIPTAMIGFMLKDAVEEIFARLHVVGYSLLATGFLLLATSVYIKINKSKEGNKVGFLNSIVIGIAQGMAVIPGISRSGATICSGVLSGISKESAFRFSFLLAIPAILGASLLKFHKIEAGFASGDYLNFICGGIAAMVTGLISISLLLKVIRQDKLYLFGIYCIVVSALVIILL